MDGIEEFRNFVIFVVYPILESQITNSWHRFLLKEFPFAKCSRYLHFSQNYIIVDPAGDATLNWKQVRIVDFFSVFFFSLFLCKRKRVNRRMFVKFFIESTNEFSYYIFHSEMFSFRI